MRSAVADLDAKGITEPGVGQWGSPVVMVRTSSGAWRLCCDYREVSKHVVIPQQPLPRTDDILAGFYQMEIEEQDRPKTSFVTPDCQRQYRRLPFGFVSIPVLFQRMVDMLRAAGKGFRERVDRRHHCLYSDTWADQLSQLRQLFEALRKAKLELHPGKCAFGAQEVKYLGHLVTRDGFRACPSKVKAIVEMPRPTSANELQKFVGKCRYYRKFIPNFSQVAARLVKAQSARRDFVWTDVCDLAWTRPRDALISDAILAHPDYTRDFLLDCDGSGEGLSAVLLQAHDEGEKVVAYASRSLLEHEKKWMATDLEAAALKWALETFRPYIDGVHVTPLEYRRAKTDRCKRLEGGRCGCRNSGLPPSRGRGLSKNMWMPSRAPGSRKAQPAAHSVGRVLGTCGSVSAIVGRTRCCMARPRWTRAPKRRYPRARPVHGSAAPRREGAGPTPWTPPASCSRTTRCTGVQQVGAAPCEEAEDDGCQVLLTDGEESDDADAALVVPENETDVAMLGAGEGGVALPKAFPTITSSQRKRRIRIVSFTCH